MTTAILITLCSLLLLAYLFDVTSRRTRIPSVIFLLLLGWGMQQVLDILGIELPDLSGILPVLGTVGLILIVLEGALELELHPSKRPLVRKASAGALFGVLALGLAIGGGFYFIGDYALKDSIANAIPLCIISSAIAIPTARHLVDADREFVVYESSVSDILGVVLFNFVALNDVIDEVAVMHFGFQLIVMIVLSVIASLALTYMLRKIQHRVKFIPMILLVVLLYTLSKVYHLPSLLFILIFGLVLGNLDQLARIPLLRRFPVGEAEASVDRFHELVEEITFLVRSLFFLLFGYTLQTAEIVDTTSLLWSTGIVGLIYGIRAIQLRMSGMPLTPLLFIAPRGLITILLFLSVPAQMVLPVVNRSLLTQVIVITSLVMMVGMIGASAGKGEGAVETRS